MVIRAKVTGVSTRKDTGELMCSIEYILIDSADTYRKESSKNEAIEAARKINDEEVLKLENTIAEVPVMNFKGITPDIKVGDLVVVSIEGNSLNQPIILGLITRNATNAKKDRKADQYSSFTANTLDVLGKATLCEDTTIGKVLPDNIKCLEDMDANIKDKFGEIHSRMTSITSKITEFKNSFLEYKKI